jgi:hypothetical protein
VMPLEGVVIRAQCCEDAVRANWLGHVQNNATRRIVLSRDLNP